jgi:PAS domain S-box-containing protein
MRKSGIDIIGDCPWGTHFCQFYQTPQDLTDILIPYVKSGLEGNECCLWVTSPPLTIEMAESALRQAVPEFDRFLQKGQIEILPHSEWYLKGGTFDMRRVLDDWVAKLEQASARGFDGLRVTGNTAWLEKKDWRAFTEYEEAINSVVGKNRLIVLCTYSLEKCGALEILDVIRNHQFALIKTEKGWSLLQSEDVKRARDWQHKSEERYQSLIDLSPEAIFINRDDRIVFVNPAALRLFGASAPDQILGRSPFDLFHPDFHEIIRERVAQLRAGKPVSLIEEKIVRLDGALVDVEVAASPFVDQDGPAIQVILRDATERKRAERRLDLLAETAGRLLGSDSPRQIVDSLCRKVMDFLDCHAFFNFLVDDERHCLHLNACAGISAEEARRIEWLDYGAGVCGCAARDSRRIVCQNIGEVPDSRTDLVQSYGIRAYACHPLISQGRVLGTLSFGVRTRSRFNDDELSLMKVVSDQVAIAMERVRTQAALQKAYEKLERRVEERTEELRAVSRYSRSLIEASLDPLVTISPDGRITDANQATELATGMNRERLIGQRFSDYFTEPHKANQGYQKVISEGLVRDYPLTIRHVSGRTTDVLYNAAIYRDTAGQVQGVFAAARDVTELRAAERRRNLTNALLELFATKSSSQEYLESAVQALQGWTGCHALGIRIADENNKIPYAAGSGFDDGFLRIESKLSLEMDRCFCVRGVAQLFEDQEQSLVTAGGSVLCDNLSEFIHRLSPEQQARYRDACVKCGFVSLAVIPIRYRDQVMGAIHLADRRMAHFAPATIEFLESLAPLIGEAIHRFRAESELSKYRDHLEELVGQRTTELEAANARLQSEITERRRAEETLRNTAEELARSNRDLEQFAYVASHDLQEPLRAVAGYVELLQHRYQGKLDEKALQFIAGAADGAARMQKLITDLLAFSRVGTQRKNFERSSLAAALHTALTSLRVSIEEAGATITNDPLPMLDVDATQISMLFQNLIGNAIKFRSERPPEIHVGAKKEPGRWLLSVRDNGIGFEPQYAERIFLIFQRLHTRRQYPGTGVGLAVCKRIVERHGGVIRADSQPGSGSIFYFTLPCREENP